MNPATYARRRATLNRIISGDPSPNNREAARYRLNLLEACHSPTPAPIDTTDAKLAARKIFLNLCAERSDLLLRFKSLTPGERHRATWLVENLPDELPAADDAAAWIAFVDNLRAAAFAVAK